MLVQLVKEFNLYLCNCGLESRRCKDLVGGQSISTFLSALSLKAFARSYELPGPNSPKPFVQKMCLLMIMTSCSLIQCIWTIKVCFCHQQQYSLRLTPMLQYNVSSLRRGHANLLCIVPILSDVPTNMIKFVKKTINMQESRFCFIMIKKRFCFKKNVIIYEKNEKGVMIKTRKDNM